jgi:hypothetical protein
MYRVRIPALHSPVLAFVTRGCFHASQILGEERTRVFFKRGVCELRVSDDRDEPSRQLTRQK